MATEDTFLYIVQAQKSKHIKIGIAKDPIKRLAQLQTGNPEWLELVGAVPGSRSLEAKIHRELDHDRLVGEWFTLSDHAVWVIGNLLGWGRKTPQMIESARKARALREELEALKAARA